MDITLQSLLFFIIITIGYFIAIKPKLTLDKMPVLNIDPTTGKVASTSSTCYDEYKSSIFPKLALYLLIVCLVQFILNTAYLTDKCGGEVRGNIGVAALYTFFPWLIMFGIMMAVLIIFPGFKSAFSDVIGYFSIAGGAGDIFAKIMKNELPPPTPGSTANKELEATVDTVTKLLGNSGILINKITPDNFIEMWHMLTPLMRDDVKANTNNMGQQYKSELLALVVQKDNIGEALWYIYTAILITSIVYYNLASRGCVKSVEQIKAGYDDYLKQQEEVEAEKKATTTPAVVS
jgi:hypothetical protein